MQVHEHPGRGSPDVVLTIGYGVVAALAAFVYDAVALVIDVRGTPRKQNRDPALAFHQWHEHRGRPDFPIPLPKVAVSGSHRLDRSGLGKTRAQPQFLRRRDG